MIFYQLKAKARATDREHSSYNAVRLATMHYAPGIECKECGPWSSAARLLASDVPKAAARLLAGEKSYPPEVWKQKVAVLANLLGVGSDHIECFCHIGPPSGTVKATKGANMLFPLPGVVWLTSTGADTFRSLALTGAKLVRAARPKGYFELDVTGRVQERPNAVNRCPVCQRINGPCGVVDIDFSTWDGSDLFSPAFNPSLILLTASAAHRIAETFPNATPTRLLVQP